MEQKEKLKAKAKESAILASYYQKIFDTPEGQAVISDLFSFCGMNTSSFNGSMEDTVFNEGKRAVALRILKILKTDHESYMAMVDKALEAQRGQNDIF